MVPGVVVSRFLMMRFVGGPGMMLFMMVLAGRSVVGRGLLSIGSGLWCSRPGLLLLLLLLQGLLPSLSFLPPLPLFPLPLLPVQVIVYSLWLWLWWRCCRCRYVTTRDRLTSSFSFIFFVKGFINIIGAGRMLLVKRRVRYARAGRVWQRVRRTTVCSLNIHHLPLKSRWTFLEDK